MAQISVIVPVYNVEKFLRRCVDSILAQSFTDFSLILVDDGSPDGSGAICDGYARQDSRVQVIHQENGGLAAARNAGICRAFENGDSTWLTFIDSDDWIHPDFLAVLLEAAVQTGCRLSACGFLRTCGEPLPEGETAPVKVSADTYYCDAPADASPVMACGKLYHRSLFQSLRYPQGKYHEDEFTTYRVVYEAGQVAKVEAKLYAYYQNPDSITQSRWRPQRLDALEAFRQQMAFAREQENLRLLHRVTDSYVWCIGHQARQLARQGDLDAGSRMHLKNLRATLKTILKEGMNGRYYPFNRENLMLYEEVYPVRPLWDALHGVYALIRKGRG